MAPTLGDAPRRGGPPYPRIGEATIDCTETFWQPCYKRAGVTLSVLLPVLLGVGALILTGMRLPPRHEAAMHEARRRAESVRESRVRVIPGGQG
jgi:hypothetical protein